MSGQLDQRGFASCPSFEAGLQAVQVQVDNQLGDPSLLDTEIEVLWVFLDLAVSQATELRIRELRQELAGCNPAGLDLQPQAGGLQD